MCNSHVKIWVRFSALPGPDLETVRFVVQIITCYHDAVWGRVVNLPVVPLLIYSRIETNYYNTLNLFIYLFFRYY